MLSLFDAGIEAVLHAAARMPIVDPLVLGLRTHRKQAAQELVRRHLPLVAPLFPRVVRREPAAVQEYDARVQAAVDELRADGRSALAALDRLIYKNEEELLDDPAFPEAERLHVLHSIDRLNLHLRSYERWAALLSPLLDRAGSPVHIWDLAAGHGGFAIALKERLGARAEVVATDLCDEYLELGRQTAARRGTDVRFVRQDATDLSNLHHAGVDIFLCTQSLHHFPPGMVGRMIGEAARAARVGLCFIDGERALLPLLIMPLVMFAYGRTWPTLHDTLVSLRRMYQAEEMALIAGLAPALPTGARIEADRQPPGFLFLRVTNPQSGPT